MSTQTQTNQAPAGYSWRCCEKAVLGTGVRQVSGTKEVEKLSPQTGGKVIHFFYSGLQVQMDGSNGWFLVQFKGMVPGDTQCSGSAVQQARQRFMTLVQSLLLKRCGPFGLFP